MVDRLRCGRCCQPTLTVEPGFTSSGHMEQLLSIGELARRAGVATSTVRYYERLGLLARRPRSGQRRYRPATLRRLVFIRMLKDAGLSLDDIDGIVNAANSDEWKGAEAPAALAGGADREPKPQGYLEEALLCR